MVEIGLTWDEASEILAALETAIDLAVDAGAFANQIQLEDAFAVLRDKMFPDLPDA